MVWSSQTVLKKPPAVGALAGTSLPSISVPWRVLQYLEYGAGELGNREGELRADLSSLCSKCLCCHCKRVWPPHGVPQRASVDDGADLHIRARTDGTVGSGQKASTTLKLNITLSHAAEISTFKCPPTSLFVGKGLPLRRPCHLGFMPCWPASGLLHPDARQAEPQHSTCTCRKPRSLQHVPQAMCFLPERLWKLAVPPDCLD